MHLITSAVANKIACTYKRNAPNEKIQYVAIKI